MKKIIVLISLFISSLCWALGDEVCCPYNSDNGPCLYSPGNPFICYSIIGKDGIRRNGNCTWYAAYMRPDLIGKCTRNASEWYSQAKSAGISVGSEPMVGSIVVFHWYSYDEKGNKVDYGHVAYVKKVNSDGSFYVSEMGYGTWDGVHEWTYNKSSIDGVIGFIYPTVANLTPVKFTDSNYVYLYSNNQLWWIANETVYTLLGFRKDCNSLTADWSKIVTLPASSRANYTIRTGVIGRPESSSYDKISYRVSKINCYSANLDTTKLYILKTDNGQTKFHHVTTWETYTTLGYDPNGKDIVDISYDLFQYFGEGYSIGPTNVYEVKSYSSFLSGSTQVLEKNYSPILVPPYNLQASALDNSRLQLTWTLPDGTGEYDIRVYLEGALIRTLSWVESIIIGNLSADTTYSFQLSIFDKINGRESTKSNQVSAKTNANPPPPPIDWTIASEKISTLVDANTYQLTDEKYSHERFAGKYINYWVKIDSSNPNLSFDWRTYYTYNDERVWNAIKTTNQPAYLCQSYSYYDSVNQEYYAWHKIEANSLPYIGQYRVELWINGQNAANRCFDLTMPKPDWLRLNGNATKTSVPLFWLTMGDTNSSGDGVEVFLDDNRLIFIPGVSTGYIHTSPLACGPHTYRVREVHVYPAGTFRSPFSDPLNVMIKLDKVTGQRIN